MERHDRIHPQRTLHINDDDDRIEVCKTEKSENLSFIANKLKGENTSSLV